MSFMMATRPYLTKTGVPTDRPKFFSPWVRAARKSATLASMALELRPSAMTICTCGRCTASLRSRSALSWLSRLPLSGRARKSSLEVAVDCSGSQPIFSMSSG